MTTAVANLRHRAISMQDARTGAAYQFAHQNGGSVGFFASTTEPVFLRLVRTDKRWFELQTAVVSYTMPPDAQGEESVVDIVAMVHLADPLYYKELQEATQDHDRVLYELIVDKDVVSEDSAGVRRLSEPMMPSFDQLRLAARHGLQAQLEGMDYMKDSWVLADMDRTAIRLLQRQRGEGAAPSALEAAMAGWGPGNLQLVPADIVRRWLRAPLWMVPCPEGAMLTLDWALSSRGLVSEVLTAIFDCALTFDFRAVSKLSFAQLLVSGAMVCDGPQTVLIGERNSVALREISRAQTHGCKRTALLYGGLHGPDLDKRMQRDLGMTRKGQKWITAWRIAVPTPCTTVSNLAGALSLYLSLDALDWILTIQGIADSTAHSGCWDRAVALAFAYVLRHALLYYSIGRWVISW
eukprot:CAMPEP_0179436812 /NCGR_PEP_ID=MMETSP0799-20121207/20785_1 /TAXON_ID=46947 /ORGANISM="Geminigera cryophila, Strain CCMP2564" /LENGTH=408 /DNA_ID=CAMNT_0021217283 /DNA_START=307 /DNA_END=1530 /DNA_ORIENTATION=-